MSIGKNISILRKAKGLTQAELGDLLGVSNQAVSKWESEITMPDVMLLPEIASALGVGLEDLYGIIEEKTVENDLKPVTSDGADDRKILNIAVNAAGTNIKIRIPRKALRSILDLCSPEDNEEMESIMSILNNDITGTLVDVDTEDCKTKIWVDEYDN